MIENISIIKTILSSIKPNKSLSSIDGMDSDVFKFHVSKLNDDGYIDAKIQEDFSKTTSIPHAVLVLRITTSGEDYLKTL